MNFSRAKLLSRSLIFVPVLLCLWQAPVMGAEEESIKVFGLELGQLIQFMLAVCAPLLTALYGWWLKRKAELVKVTKETVRSQHLAEALVQLERLAFKVVDTLAQTIVQELRAKTADGKLTEEDVRHLQDVATARLYAMAGTDLIETLAAAGVNIVELLRGYIESALVTQKARGVYSSLGGKSAS